MKSRLLGAVCAFCLLAYQPVSADPLDGEIRSSSNPSFIPVGFSSDLLLNQNVPSKPPGSHLAVPAPLAPWLFGGVLLGLVVTARSKKT